MDLNIDLTNIKTVINKSFYPLLFNKKRYMILRGGRGSGKSHFTAQKIIYRILEDISIQPDFKHKILCLRKYSANCDRSIVADIKSVLDNWGLIQIYKYNKIEKSFTFINGSQILCSGLDDPEKIKSIHGITSLWFEEATEFKREDFDSTVLSMRGLHNKSYYQTILSFNPISKHNWVYSAFFSTVRDDTEYHHSTFLDNRYIDREYSNVLKNIVGSNSRARKVLIEGEWGSNDESLIYSNYETIKDFPEVEGQIVIGVDFGFSHPSAVIKLAEYKDGYAIQELLYKSGLTNERLAEEMKIFINKKEKVICDNARPEAIKTLCENGIRAFPCKKNKDSVNSGISHLQSKRLYITEDSSNIFKELSLYSWKKTKDGQLLDEPEKEFDDLCDAIRYATDVFRKKSGLTKPFILG